LRGFLDNQREALIDQVQGLSESEARSTPTVSALSILSILKHSAIWEGRWFQEIVAGRGSPEVWSQVESEDEDPTFWLSEEDTVESVVAYYREPMAVADEIVASIDLDTPCAWNVSAHRNLRWVVLHLIEETARHAGHADIIRETIDGSRGL
jgi:uncharacterized damage-inducible protein DinB